MKKLIAIITILIASTISFISCEEEFLERHPLNEASDVAFYRNADDALAAINAVYDVMQYGFMYKLEISITGDRYNNDQGLLPRNDFPTGFLPTNERRLSMWAPHYAGINRANIALDRVADIDMDAGLKARLLAEAKLLRGFYYFTLATIFGDVPIRLEPSNLETLNKAKSPRADVLTQAIKDVQEAEQVLPLRSTQAGEDLGRVTKGTATALLGKIYLYEKNWSMAASKFSQVIGRGEYFLNADYMPQFQLGGDNSPESIFEVQFQGAGPGWNESSDGSWVSGWYGVPGHANVINFGFGPFAQVNQEFVDAIEPTDARMGHIVEEGDDYLGTPFLPNSNTGFGSLKFIVPKTAETGPGDSPINHPLIRYSDLLLMYAEALNEDNGGPTQEAYDAINDVRDRANLLPLAGLSQQEFFDAVVKERRVELYLEGHRTWDLIRWGLAGTVLGPTNGFVEGKHEFMPIPQSELNANADMVQNPNYN